MTDARPATDATEDVPALATLHTRGFAGHPGKTIALATFVGLFAVGTAAAAGLHPFISVVGLVAAIVAVLALGAGDTQVQLTQDGIRRTVTPMAARFIALPPRQQWIPFDAIRAYRRDHDLSRFHGEVAFLTLSLRRPPYRVTIHDRQGAAAFATFADAFEQLAVQHHVERRPGFYSTSAALLLTIGFAGSAVVLIAFALMGVLSATSLFRLLVIIIPGTLYMAYRTAAARQRSDKSSKPL